VYFGDYGHALTAVFLLAFIGTVAIALLPKHGPCHEAGGFGRAAFSNPEVSLKSKFDSNAE
jgi:hypothetical protein